MKRGAPGYAPPYAVASDIVKKIVLAVRLVGTVWWGLAEVFRRPRGLGLAIWVLIIILVAVSGDRRPKYSYLISRVIVNFYVVYTIRTVNQALIRAVERGRGANRMCLARNISGYFKVEDKHRSD